MNQFSSNCESFALANPPIGCDNLSIIRSSPITFANKRQEKTMDDGVFASRRMTEVIIRENELKATRAVGRKRIHKRKFVPQFNSKKLKLWTYYYKSMELFSLKRIS